MQRENLNKQAPSENKLVEDEDKFAAQVEKKPGIIPPTLL